MNQLNLILKEEAKADIKDAFDYYEKQLENLGHYFLSDVENTLSSIKKIPLGFDSKYKPFRKIPLDVFPFIMLYEVEEKDIVVYLVFNTSQDPKKIVRQLKRLE